MGPIRFFVSNQPAEHGVRLIGYEIFVDRVFGGIRWTFIVQGKSCGFTSRKACQGAMVIGRVTLYSDPSTSVAQRTSLGDRLPAMIADMGIVMTIMEGVKTGYRECGDTINLIVQEGEVLFILISSISVACSAPS